MLEFLLFTFALGVVVLLTAFFRVYGKAPSSSRNLIHTSVIALAAFTLFICEGTNITAQSGLNVPLLTEPNGNGVLTLSDLLSLLSCAALGAMSHSYLYALIRTASTSSDDDATITSTPEQSA
ncbi:hypothetical protein [Loktanella fryxellensis]|uniref:hypothetical protein n=1 Tax=Loktanella fryxellensis TaxID=245187 RepID=UPI00115FEB85|nr:hypothetical protein [Loktanella fryxellensis]